MEFISRFNTSFIVFVNRKYNKRFLEFENYSLWLVEKNDDPTIYYETLEQDVREYCNWQLERKASNGEKRNQPAESSRE